MNIRRMTCAVCGESTHGRQWHDRDTGYGICPRCWDDAVSRWESQRREPGEDPARLYGIPGVHHSVAVTPD